MSKKDRGYVRVSTQKDSQRDSPENQESFIRENARREGIELDYIYEDRDTGTNIIAREDVQRMIADAKNGEIRSIWFASLSRFSRDTLDALSLKRILVNALKIRVVSLEDGYDSAQKDDELLFGIKAVVNQNTSGDISTASRRGIRESALEKGNIIASKPAFGYRKITIEKRKTYEIVTHQAEIVVLIYDLYCDEGMGDKAIVKYLNGDNPAEKVYESYTGKLWSLSTVQSILQNPTYTGYNVTGRYTSELVYDDLNDLMNRRKKLVKKPPSEWEWSKLPTHPAIISKERFDYAQEIRLSKGGTRGGRRSFVNVFSKMIFCSHCESAMVSMTSTGRDGKRYRYLMCSRRRRVGATGCSNDKWIPYEDARDELIEEILTRMRKAISKLEKNGMKELEVFLPQNNNDKEKRKLEKRIEDNRKLMFEIRRQHMLHEIDTAQYDFEKEQYEKEIEASEQRLSRIVAEEKRMLDRERLIKNAKKTVQELTDITAYNDNVEKTRSLLTQVVKRIYVSVDGEITVETYI
ncbi:site-specific DNA recombinase [Paenibacillus sp. 4624]|uniref:recombinase family protein n=1 Tax=Paenibacillus sp. 4624 TaxID=3156453 RepID=UPI003D261F9B